MSSYTHTIYCRLSSCRSLFKYLKRAFSSFVLPTACWSNPSRGFSIVSICSLAGCVSAYFSNHFICKSFVMRLVVAVLAGRYLITILNSFITKCWYDHFLCFRILTSVMLIIGLAQAIPAKEKPTAKCNAACTDDYTPVCGGVKGSKDKPISFGNECVMQKYNCENKKSKIDFTVWLHHPNGGFTLFFCISGLTVLSQGECPGGGGVRLQ